MRMKERESGEKKEKNERERRTHSRRDEGGPTSR